MRRTSPPGGTSRPAASAGSIFLDALLALAIGTAAMSAALGGLALAARVAAQRWREAQEVIGGRNERAGQRPVVFAEAERR